MADYISSLTGVAMDMALQDMAEHNSEAWAVGERNGIPVGSDDVTYQNNAQYYAQQAQSIAPASVTEAVRWDIAQTALTDANKAQARSNIDAGKNGAWSNRNLLDNAYFVGGGSQLGDGHFPINQKGQTSYSVGQSATGIDRWYTINTNSVYTLQSDELVVSSSSFSVLGQKIFNPIPAGTYTLSIKMGSVGASQLALYVDFADSGVSDFRTSAAAGEIVTSTFTATAPITFVRFFTDGGNSFSVQAVKLEEGTVSTLANDPPPDFGEELRKCQRYLWVANCEVNDIMASGVTFGTNVIFDLITPVQIRGTQANVAIGVTPYIAVDNTLVLCGGSSAQANIKGNHARFQIGATADLGTYKNCNLLIPAVTFLQVANEL